MFEDTRFSNVKERARKIEKRKKYLPNYVGTLTSLPGSERPCTKFCFKTIL
jgi:hypothetical protein